MNLVEITTQQHGVLLNLAYATENNFTGAPIYSNDRCYLHVDAERCLTIAINYAGSLGYKLMIYDAFRPTEAQWILWEHSPNPDFLANPRTGSPHSRGVAVDLTLLDQNGKELEMGTKFDDFCTQSHHGNLEISPLAQRNRYILMGIMTTAGWDFYQNEWWHYQLFKSKNYPLLSASTLAKQ